MISSVEEENTEVRQQGQPLKRGITRVLNTLLTAVLLIMLGFVIFVTISAARGSIVSVFGKSVLVVVTGSMEPSLHVGDYIYIEKVPPESLAEGDVISFYSEAADIRGMLVTHRITGINEDGSFVTRGDANPVEDSVAVRPERIVGKYIAKARFFRWVSSFGDARKLMLILVMIPTAIAAVYEIRTIAKLGEKISREKRAAAEERERMIREAIDMEKERLAKEGCGEKEDNGG